MAERTARVHRFQNKVAIDTETGTTVYISAELATLFAKAMLECAADIEKQPKFSLSNFSTQELKG
jgi:hypothetical protein